MHRPLLAPDAKAPEALNAASDAGSTASWNLVDPIPALHHCLMTSFQGTRVLEAQPDFFNVVLNRAHQIIFKHAVAVLGPAGAGKTTLVKAMAPDFQPSIEPGPFMKNRTQEAQGVGLQIGMWIANEELEAILIDTPGWSHDTSTDIKKQIKRILRERQLVSEHTPHIILLCIPVSFIRQFQGGEAERMSKQLHELKFDQCFPMKVFPVATKADSERLQDRKQLLSTVKQLAEKAFKGTGAHVEDAICTMFPPHGFPPGEEADDGVEQVKDRIRTILFDQINSPQFKGLWQKHFAKSLAEHTMKHCEQFPENDSALRLHQKAYRTVEAICERELPNLAKHEPQDVLHLPWEKIMEVAESERDAVAESQTVWLYFSATFFGSWWRAACWLVPPLICFLIWLVLPLIYHSSKGMSMEWPFHTGYYQIWPALLMVYLLLPFLQLAQFLLKSIRHSIAWELRYSRYLRMIRVQRRWLAVFAVLLIMLSAMQLHVTHEELSKMAQKYADDMTNKAHTINVSETQLRVMTMKFELEKRQADEMAHKNLDLQRHLDVMTKKSMKEKEQADGMFQKNTDMQTQLDVMTQKSEKEKEQADEMAHKNLDLRRQLDVMTKTSEKEKKQADEMFRKNTVMQKQLDVMAQTAENEKRRADGLAREYDDLTSCTWKDQTTQCLDLFLLGTVNDADACKDVCCKMGQDQCSTWQFDKNSGCWVGNPKSCDGDYGHWTGGQRI